MTLDEAIAIMEDPTKHTMTCSQGELTAWLKELKETRNLLREALPILHRAFFANHNDTSAANELYDRITKIVGRE